MKKRFLYILLAILVLASGCTGKSNDDDLDDSKKTVTVTTTFIADMVDILVGDEVNLQIIVPAGADPHMYEANPKDLEKIKSADLLLYHGLHFEGRMEDILGKKGKAITEDFMDQDLIFLNEDGGQTVDPHFWFDINLYKKAVEKVSQYLADELVGSEDSIQANLETYLQDLDRLNSENKKKLSEIPQDKRYLITPHDAFNYFSRLYDIEVVAPQGVSTDSEVGTADLEDTANFIVDHEIKAIFLETTTNPDRMNKLKEICKSKGFEVNVVSGQGKELYSDSLGEKGSKADTYLKMYKSNVDLIVENLK